MLDETAVFGGESGGSVTINIELADDFAVDAHRHHDLGLRFDGTGEVARIGGDVVHHDGFAAGCSGPADALVERDASVRGGRANVWAEHENVFVVGVASGLDH